jgi:hypothetical protein
VWPFGGGGYGADGGGEWWRRSGFAAREPLALEKILQQLAEGDNSEYQLFGSNDSDSTKNRIEQGNYAEKLIN